MPSPSSEKWCSASRLVRLDTGSSIEAVLASHTVVMTNGTALRPSCRATAMTTGVSRTAVVSRLSTIVARQERSTSSSHSSGVRCAAEPGGPVAGDVEDPGDVGDLGDDGDRHEERQHRPDPLAQVQQVAGVHRVLVWRTQG